MKSWEREIFFTRFRLPEKIVEYNKPKVILRYNKSASTVYLVALLIYFFVVKEFTKIIIKIEVPTLRELKSKRTHETSFFHSESISTCGF